LGSEVFGAFSLMQIANQNPHVTITGRHLAVTATLRDYAQKKIEGLHLDYPRIIEAHVILEVDKYRHRAEVVLVCCNHITIEASEESPDLYASLDQVIDKVARQMRKFKTRLLRSHRPRRQDSIRYLQEQVYNAEAFDEPELATAKGYAEAPPEPEVVQTERYAVKPMFVDEAVLQMEMSSRQFLVFQNARSEKVNVLYRRKNGDFGLIEPVLH
jgi:putative sigma-54 modulation protein